MNQSKTPHTPNFIHKKTQTLHSWKLVPNNSVILVFLNTKFPDNDVVVDLLNTYLCVNLKKEEQI